MIEIFVTQYTTPLAISTASAALAYRANPTITLVAPVISGALWPNFR
jgi:hypothetical protein